VPVATLDVSQRLKVTSIQVLHPGKNSSEVIHDIFAMHISPPCSVLDLTFGLGGFWKWGWRSAGVDLTVNDQYSQPKSPGLTIMRHDFTSVPIPDNSFDVVVFDPPFTANGPQRGTDRHQDRYGATRDLVGAPQNMKDVHRLMELGTSTATRLARRAVIIKTQDVIESDRYWDSEEVLCSSLKSANSRAEDNIRYLNARQPQPDKVRGSKIKHFRNRPSVFIYALPDRSRRQQRT